MRIATIAQTVLAYRTVRSPKQRNAIESSNSEVGHLLRIKASRDHTAGSGSVRHHRISVMRYVPTVIGLIFGLVGDRADYVFEGVRGLVEGVGAALCSAHRDGAFDGGDDESCGPVGGGLCCAVGA